MAAAEQHQPRASARQIKKLLEQQPTSLAEVDFVVVSFASAVAGFSSTELEAVLDVARSFFASPVCADAGAGLQTKIDELLEKVLGATYQTDAQSEILAKSGTSGPAALPNIAEGAWLHKQEGDECHADAEQVAMKMTRTCDMWQRTYYGFRFDTSPARVWPCIGDSTFTAAAHHAYRSRFDQCGLLVYIDEDCWAKASIEWETADMSHLGSVVTNAGFSDWATQEVPSTAAGCTWYRVSRRGADFCFEWSQDGTQWAQLRVFHLAGSVSASGARLPVQVGVYAASPVQPTCSATFTHLTWEPCQWKAHEA